MVPTRLPPVVREALVGDGLVRRRDLDDLGTPGSTVDRLLRRKLLVPLANGVYTDPDMVAGATPWELFRLRTRAFVIVSPPNTYAADWSSIVVHRLPRRETRRECQA